MSCIILYQIYCLKTKKLHKIDWNLPTSFWNVHKKHILAPAWGFCYSIFSFMCMFCRSLFAPFLLHIVLSVLLQFTDSDYPFGIFKFFLLNTPLTNQRSIFVLVIVPIHITKFVFEHCHTQGCRTWTGNFSAAGQYSNNIRCPLVVWGKSNTHRVLGTGRNWVSRPYRMPNPLHVSHQLRVRNS